MNEEEVIEQICQVRQDYLNNLYTQTEFLEKLKYLRDIIGPNMPEPLVNPYGQIIQGVNPSDQAMFDWTQSQKEGFLDWCYTAYQ